MSANPPPQNGNTPSSGALVNVPRGAGGLTSRTGATGSEMTVSGETASSAMASMARANVEARFMVARAYPRDWMVVRDKLLKACERSGFAEVAIYKKPIGRGIEGPSIRMAEEAARCMGNICTDVVTTYEDREKRILQVSATDLEANLTHPCTVVVTKTVERSKADKGQRVYGQRYNSKGEVVYEVEATDDDILNKQNALVSKGMRTCILRLVPGDIMEEAMAAAYATRKQTFRSDPAEAVKKMCDEFSVKLSVSPGQLAAYLGHPVTEVTLDEIEELRGVYQAILDKEATWTDALAFKMASRTEAAASSTPPANDGNPPPATGAGPAPTAPQASPGSGPKPTPPPRPTIADAAAKAQAERLAKAAASKPEKRLTIEVPPTPPPPIDDDLISRPPPRDPGEEG